MRVIARRPVRPAGVYLCARGNECERDLLRSLLYTHSSEFIGVVVSFVSYLHVLRVHEGAFNRLSLSLTNRDKTLDVRNARWQGAMMDVPCFEKNHANSCVI